MAAHSTNADDYQQLPCAVAAMEKNFVDGQRIPEHSHQRGQLMYATRGVMRVGAAGKSWVVPSGRAMWVPARTRHGLDMVGAVAMLTLYIDANAALPLGAECRMIAVSTLLHALLRGALDERAGYAADSRGDLIARLVLIELARREIDPLHFAMPQDARLLRICQGLLKQPGSRASLEEWATLVGASPRTLARRFQAETGLGFAAWRQQVRLADAVCQLGRGRAVKQVALDLGYRSPSAFVSMFRTALGQSPASYAAL